MAVIHEKNPTPNSVNIVLTNKCDMDCSFCGAATYMQRDDVPLRKQKEAMVEYIKNNPAVDEIMWTGGEPLLAYRRLVELSDELLAHQPSAEQYLYTNGHKLRLEQLEFLKRFKRVVISIDGYANGERTVQSFVDNNEFEAFETIASLDNATTWAVVTREQMGGGRWYEDVMKMHNALHHLGFGSMSLVIDYNMPKILTPDHCLNLIYGYKRLMENMRRLNEKNQKQTVFRIEKFFQQPCNSCSDTVVIQPDTDQYHLANKDMLVDNGCNMLAERMGKDAYQYLWNFLFPSEK